MVPCNVIGTKCQNIVERLRVQMEKTMLVTFSVSLWRRLNLKDSALDVA